MLTPKQHNLLVYIDNFIKETGHSPSFEEMKEAVGLKSKSGIHALINALEERGFIRKLAHKARALEVLKMPQPPRELPHRFQRYSKIISITTTMNTLITPAQAVALAFADGEYLAPESVTQSDIAAAEQRYLVPVIGRLLYEKLLSGSHAGFTTF